MPFLFPAVSAAVCDIAIIYLSRSDSVFRDPDDEVSSRLVYQSSYVFPTAAIRIFLLMIPLPYHSYNGTALKWPHLYLLLYGGTLLVLLLHMLSLSMIDPESLGLLVPSQVAPTPQEITVRNLWFVLILSLVADFCHLTLFLHVRSTAPADVELSEGRPKVLLYYVKEREETELDSLISRQDQTFDQRESTDPSNRIGQISNKFVLEVQSRINHAKTEWTKQLDDYRVRSGGGQDLLQRPLTPFRVLLQLFAYEDVLSNGKLDAVYHQDEGAALMFFVPQLLSFLLHGAYDCSPRLEEWILETCKRNIYFAHRCYWFLRAWSLEASNTKMFKSNSLTSFEASSEESDSFSLDAPGSKFLPEERAVIEQLLNRVIQCGEEPAQLLNFGSGLESESSLSTDGTTSSPSALMFATESGAIPIDPITGIPSVKHWDCVAARRKYGFLPLDQALASPNQTRNSDEGPYFDATPAFLDALLNVADNLFRVQREHRNDEFRRQLKLLEVQALPSNAIYLPLQDVNHRVWRIVADESIAISTKERVPCIICMEVVEYADTEKAQRWDVRRLLEQMSPPEAHLLPDLGVLSERELINRFRYGHRDPHRRDTAFEKLRYGVRHGMQNLHLDQMKTSMQAQIEKLRDTTNIQDFWSLNLPETLEGEEDEEDNDHAPLHTLEPAVSTDIERGVPNETTGTPSKPGGLFTVPNPKSPATPASEMGQWTSPCKVENVDQTLADTTKDVLITPPNLNPTSYQRTDGQFTHGSLQQSGKNALNGKNSGGASNGNKLPSETQGLDRKGAHGPVPPRVPTKPPPVVFKENWKEKEDRLRASSAFGSHPGWKLLPILVKANDDLRQEQLASQLIYRISVILARERVPVWLCPYSILALTETGGLIEAIPDTISIASLKKNDPNYTSLKGFFNSYFTDPDDLANAKANFCESLAAYSIVCFLLQIKDRHNGNILIDNKGHLIHIDFGFFFLSSPGKNTGFESAPFKLTREFVDVMGGPDSRLFRIFRMLCYRSFLALRRHCMEIILLVEMLKTGNEHLACFRGRPDDAIKELRQRFRLDLNDRACLEYVNALIDESLENWRTNWYDRYQRYCVGVL